MNWLALKVTNPKRFNELDKQWRVENKEYLRKYNTKHRYWARWYRRKVDEFIIKLCTSRNLGPTQRNIGRVFKQASFLALQAEVRARRK